MGKYLAFIGFISLSQILSGQTISVGVLGGVPVADSPGGHDESKPYIVGGSVEVRLPAGFALEADALYRRLGNTSTFSSFAGTEFILFPQRARGNAWEFPLLGKYYFRRTAAWQPFVGTGFAFRTIGRHDQYSDSILYSTPLYAGNFVQADSRSPLDVGAVVAAGVRMHAGRFAILPQVRYTRWGGSNNLASKNETSFLLGLTF